ncbi:MAG: hypothetical protein DWQ08_07690, partial [Proteobacteria bacterium]
MRHFILALAASVLLAGCSSGGDSSSGGGVVGVAAGTTGLLIFVVLEANDLSVDTVPDDCSNPLDGVLDQLVSTAVGTANVTVRDNSIIATGNNKGVIFTSYTISFKPVSGGAPALQSRAHGTNLPIILAGAEEATGDIGVVLIELDTTIPEFNAKNPAGNVYTYTVTITLRGSRTDTG